MARISLTSMNALAVIKRVAALLLGATLFWAWVSFLSTNCLDLSAHGALSPAWRAPLDRWIVPIASTFILHVPIYDIVSLATLLMGIEARWDDLQMKTTSGAEISRPVKFFVAYPVFVFVVALFGIAWTKIIFCV